MAAALAAFRASLQFAPAGVQPSPHHSAPPVHPSLQDVDEALKRLPQEVLDQRNQRLKRACDINMKVRLERCA